MVLPSRKKDIEIGKNSYTVTIPTNRQFMSIYSRKAVLSKENYDALQYSMDGNARYAALLIDTIATLENIMPEQFFKDVNLKSILDGDILQGAELVKVYQEQIQGWLNEITAAIANVLNPPKTDEVAA